MGDKHNISKRVISCTPRTAVLATCTGLLIFLTAMTGAANDESAEPAVSTSPIEESLHSGPAAETQPSLERKRPALTRAATRERVSSISPVDWLGRFGSVEVGRRP